MKVLLVLASLVFAGSSFAQSAVAWSSATTLSPFATATKLLQSATGTIVSPFISTTATFAASIDARGVAGKEQMKDELVALDADMVAGRISKIEEVEQPALKELFEEISADETKMNDVNAVVGSGTKLQRVATAVTMYLMAE